MYRAAMEMSQLDFDLPAELIAQEPSPQRDGSRLMVLDRAGEGVQHRQFRDIGALLKRGDLLVLNDTRVVPCRAYGWRAGTGGVVEIFATGAAGAGLIHAMTGSKGKLQAREKILIRSDGERDAPPELVAELLSRGEDGLWLVRLDSADGTDPVEKFRQLARMPLPPYIKRERFGDPADQLDRVRYQTAYAAVDGAVAAPTAGLHFTPELLDQLRLDGVETAYLTLHVGMGTFQPVKADRLEDHQMHSERYLVSQATARTVNRVKQAGRRIVAVGSTSTRVLEAVALANGGWLPERDLEGSTDLLIAPGYQWQVVSGMVTNFHLPRSTLLALVMAFAGEERTRAAYAEAVRQRYRFFSYGDAMLLL